MGILSNQHQSCGDVKQRLFFCKKRQWYNCFCHSWYKSQGIEKRLWFDGIIFRTVDIFWYKHSTTYASRWGNPSNFTFQMHSGVAMKKAYNQSSETNFSPCKKRLAHTVHLKILWYNPVPRHLLLESDSRPDIAPCTGPTLGNHQSGFGYCCHLSTKI